MNKCRFVFLVFNSVSIFLSCVDNKGDLSDIYSKFSLIIDGSFDDKSFNESALKGAQKVKGDFQKELILKTSTSNSFLSDLEGLKDAGSELIWLIGYKFSDIAISVALENPEIKYAIIDPIYSQDVTIPKNLAGMTFRSQEGAFLTGYIAAKITKTGKIGFLGGIKGDIVDSFRYGYESGAKYANKTVNVLSRYTNSFTDFEVGSSMARKMYLDGIDIIHHAAGLGGLGAIEVAKKLGTGYYIIGVDNDQSYLAPDNIITSSIKDVGKALNIFTSNYFKSGVFSGGKLTNYGLKEGVVGFIQNLKMISLELSKKVENISNKIINEEFIVPWDEKSYKAFLQDFVDI